MGPYRILHVLSCFILFCGAATAQEPQSKEAPSQATPGPLTLVSPSERQVFQRDSHEEASVLVSGTAPAGARVIEAMAQLSAGAKRGRNVDWMVIAEADGIKDGRFGAHLKLASGGWYTLRIRARSGDRVLAETKIERVGVGDVFITAGQSNSANFGQVKQAAKDSRVVYFDGKSYQPAKDPIPGGFGGGGSPWSILGDRLAAEWNVPICFRSATITYTDVAQWTPAWARESGHKSSQYEVLLERTKQFGPRGVRAVLWHQGESDSLAKTTAEQYRDRLTQAIEGMRKDIGYPVDWFVAQASFHPDCSKQNQQPVAEGQKLIWESKVAQPGPVTDDLSGKEYRYDRVHFSEKGLQEHARRWFTAITKKPAPAVVKKEPGSAEVPSGLSLARIFAHHMVLQQEKPVKIWGWAEKGEKVTVTFAGQTKTAIAGADGQWRVQLDPLKAGFEGRELTASSGTSTVNVKDVLVGEVWLCGGQSNMSFPLWVRKDGFDDSEANKFPFIRSMSTLHLEFADPPYDVSKGPKGEDVLCWAQKAPLKELPFAREWMVFGPDCLKLHGRPFSAVGFYYAKKLYEQLKVPVGIVDTSVGGTLAHYWASVEELRKIPEMAPIFAKPSPPWYPACLFNTTVLPIRDLTVRGALFYLGENNSQGPVHAANFETTYRAVITTWRNTIGERTLPFGIIQTAGCGGGQSVYGPGPGNLVQEAQLRIHLTTPNTGFVVTADDLHSDLHVMRKQSIAERAVRWAMAEVYAASLPKDKEPPTWRGPVFKSLETKDNRLILRFETMNNEALKITGTPVGFVVAGEDGQFQEAQAELVGKTSVAVWSDKVSKPVAARFAWAGRPYINLWTESGLPTSPFRTDDWPISSKREK